MNEVSRVRRINDFVVGVTVLGMVVLILAAVLWLKQADLRGSVDRVIVRTRDVGGVSLGNPVVIRGVRSGRVESIALGDHGWVVLTLSLDKDVALPPDPVVLISASSLFGEWQATVASATGLPADRELRAAITEARTGSDTLPGATLPDIAQLTSVAGRIAGDVAQVAERVQVAFDDSAAREMRSSIKNFARLSADLSRTVTEQSKNLNRVTTDVQQGVRSINNAASTINRIADRVDSSTSQGELRELVVNSRRAAEELVVVTSKLRTMSEDFDRTQKQLAQTVSRADSVLGKINSGQGSFGLFVNDPHLYKSSDSLVTELRSLILDLRTNPRRYINVRIF